MNFTMSSIKIKSNWFNFDTQFEIYDNKFQKMGVEGFNLYIQLFKFRLYNQKYDYHFLTSISHLKKECGYTVYEILDLLKLLVKLDVIKILNVSNWNYLIEWQYDENGNKLKKEIVVEEQISKTGKTRKRTIKPFTVNDKYILEIIAVDVPKFKTDVFEESGNDKQVPATDNDYFISVSLDVFQEYKNRGLNEKYYPVYCLLQKLSNFSKENKSFMSIDNMAKVLGMDQNTLHRMIIKMNKKYVLYSRIRKGNYKNGYFNHYLGHNMKALAFIEKEYKNKINKNFNS